MLNKRELHCLVPGLVNACRASQALQSSGQPAVNYFFSRADHQPYKKNYTQTLSDVVDLNRIADTDLPTAAVKAHHLLPEKNTETWVEAYPVNLLPDRDKLFLKPFELIDTETDYPVRLNVLLQKFATHFESDISQVLLSPDGAWLLQVKLPASIRTCALQDALGHHIQGFLPYGKAEQKWRALMNEMQMFMHMHDAEQLGFNALWLEGVGSLPDKANTDYGVYLGNDFLPEALAGFLGRPWQKSIDTLSAHSEEAGPFFYIDTGFMLDFINSPAADSNALKNFDRLLSQAVDGLKRKLLDRVIVYDFSNAIYSLDRRGILSFWRHRKILSARV